VEISFTAGCCSLSPGFGRGETGGGNWRKLDTHLLREGPGEPGKEPGKVDTHLPPTSGRSWRTWKSGEGGGKVEGRWTPTYFGKELENLEKSRGNWTPTYFGKKLENLESVGTYLPRG